MITDYMILGIEETDDINLIKSAFRKKIKKLHPDLANEGDPIKNHFLFVEVCNAYNRLIGNKKNTMKRKDENITVKSNVNEITVHHDPAYVFYKTGMKNFMKIHPSQWNETNKMLNTKIAGHEKDQLVIKQRLLELARLLPRSYYYFRIVVQEYPDSIWAHDSNEKIKIIEDRMIKYNKIIDSFTSWN
jgi:hypothetical protein